MMNQAVQSAISEDHIARKIYVIGSRKVMLDSDLAEFYGITTGNLNKAVKRNIERFPEDFMFQLTKEECDSSLFQSGTPKKSGRGGRQSMPYAFTEHGTLMLSSILNSKRAIDVNILIIRTFVKLREILALHEDVARKLEEHDQHISNLYAHLEKILQFNTQEKNPIGYIWEAEKE